MNSSFYSAKRKENPWWFFLIIISVIASLFYGLYAWRCLEIKDDNSLNFRVLEDFENHLVRLPINGLVLV